MLTPRVWLQVLRGEVDIRRTTLFSYLRGLIRRRTPLLSGSAPRSFIDALGQLKRDDVSITLAFSSNEDMPRELEHRGLWPQVQARPNVTCTDVAGLDHNLRSLAAQRDVHRIVLEALERAMRPSADAAAAGPQRRDGLKEINHLG